MDLPINKIIHGDCLEVMQEFPDDCIDLTITSPPYDNLREYQGYTFDFESIAKELYRVMKPGGVPMNPVTSVMGGSIEGVFLFCKRKLVLPIDGRKRAKKRSIYGRCYLYL